VTAASRPHPDETATADPEPNAPPPEPRVIVRRRSPGWPAPRKVELPRGDEATE